METTSHYDDLSIYLSIYLSINLSVCLSIFLSVCLFVCLSIYLASSEFGKLAKGVKDDISFHLRSPGNAVKTPTISALFECGTPSLLVNNKEKLKD